MRLHASDAKDCRLSNIQNIAADSVAMQRVVGGRRVEGGQRVVGVGRAVGVREVDGGRRPWCLRASQCRARSVVAPSRMTCKSTVGVSAARNV